MLTRSIVAIAAGLTAMMAAYPATAARAYTATPIGPVSGPVSEGFAINSAGQITGATFISFSVYHAFLYSDGLIRDLGTLGGTTSQGLGINDSGQVTGTSDIGDFFGPSRAFLYSAGTMIDLGTLGFNSAGYSINNSGQITGAFYTDTSTLPHTHAFLYSGGTMTDLGTLGGLTSAGSGINNSGQITGTSWINNNPQEHAFVYTGGVMHDIGTLGGPNSKGVAINDLGQVTGESATTPIGPPTNSETHAFLYSGSTMIDLGTFGGALSVGLGINRHGEVVGQAQNKGLDDRAFLYADGTLYDLTTLVVSGLPASAILGNAYGINDHGQIVANAYCFRTLCGAGTYRLDLVVSPPALIAVPTLSSWALGATAILLLGAGLLCRFSTATICSTENRFLVMTNSSVQGRSLPKN